MLDPELFRHFIFQYGYLALFVGAIVEGFHVMLLAGFLSATNYLSLLPAFIAVSAGCFLADSAIYFLGYFGGKDVLEWITSRFKKLRGSLDVARRYLHKYPARIFFTVKITTGLAIATILMAGASRMKPAKFLGWNLLSNFLVAGILMLLGYFFGQSYLLIYDIFHYWAFVFLAVLIFLFLYFNHYLARKFNKNQKTSD